MRNTAASIFSSLSTLRTFFSVSLVVESMLNISESTSISQKNSAMLSVSVRPLVFNASDMPRVLTARSTSRMLGISRGSP